MRRRFAFPSRPRRVCGSTKELKKEPKKAGNRGRSSEAPCMIVFCAFEQMQTLIAAAKKHGFNNYIPLVFIKNYSRFLEKMLKAKTVRISANIYQQGAPIFEFDVSNFRQESYKPRK